MPSRKCSNIGSTPAKLPRAGRLTLDLTASYLDAISHVKRRFISEDLPSKVLGRQNTIRTTTKEETDSKVVPIRTRKKTTSAELRNKIGTKIMHKRFRLQSDASIVEKQQRTSFAAVFIQFF